MRNQKGFTLIEVLVALVLMGLLSVVCLNGLVIAHRSTIIADEQTTALSLAQSQIEYVKESPYADTYSLAPIPDEYEDGGYSAVIDVTSINEGTQKITVTIKRRDKEITALEAYKVNRE